MSSAQLRLRLFGPPAVTDSDGVPLKGGNLEPPRLALLALLALHPKRTVSRAELTRYLWPAENSEQARQALNQALFAISKALGDDAIFPSTKEVRLGTRVSVDALEFESELDAGRREDAMRLYTAPLLDGFELDDAPEFRAWAATQRARFATVARAQNPAAATATEVQHDLSEPEDPEPTPEVAREETPVREEPRETKSVIDLPLLAEPELHARVERSSEAPELHATVLPEPDLLTNEVRGEEASAVPAVPTEPLLMTNAVPEQESGASITRPETHESENVVPPPSAPREEISWITPSEPSPPAHEEIEDAPPPPPRAPEPQEEVFLAEQPPAPVESKPDARRPKRRRRKLPLPSARFVLIVLSLVALGALGYMARGWIGVAKGSIAAVSDRADAARQARDRERSIAVLPIEYSGPDQADAVLAQRITRELGPMLTGAGLLVISSTPLTRRGPPYDLRVIADSLKVAHILQGVMQREDSGVAFRFRLVNPANGTTRWDDTYRPKPGDIKVLEEDVAAMVATRILQGSRERD